jgi:hemerythrin-like domain-containing protein
VLWNQHLGNAGGNAIVVTVIYILREEHRNIARLLNALEHQIEIFARAGAPDYDVIRGIAEYFLDYPDRCHHPKEDVVFDRLCARFPRDAAEVGDLATEHRKTAESARRFRDTVYALLDNAEIARETVVNAARGFIEGERRHMAMEEERFFPLAEARLTPEDWLRIESDLVTGRDPLFGDRVEAEFEGLRKRLLAWEEECRTI